MFRLLALLLLLLPAMFVHAEPVLEVHELSFRSAEEIIPLIRPHLGDAASLSGQGTKLIVRAEPARQREVAELIEQLDLAPRSLRIAVRTGAQMAEQQSGAGIDGRIGRQSSSGSLRIYRSEDARVENLDQQVRALEGRPAFIAAGISVPVTDRTVVIGEQTGVREQTRYVELNKGFYASARIFGDQVEVDIAAEHAAPRQGGFARHQVLTTVSGRLGEWLSVGATTQGAARDDRGIVHRSRDARGSNRGVWLKVDALD